MWHLERLISSHSLSLECHAGGDVRPPFSRALRLAGYTLSEIVVVVALMGILSLIAVPIYSGIRNSSLENAAMHSARLVNAARESYALTVPGNAAAWAGAVDDQARLELLISENLLAGSPEDYLTMYGNYGLQLSGGVRAATVLLHEGHSISY
jgi:prepilin-type N-terminal cleavage/methylation domain-containing protein